MSDMIVIFGLVVTVFIVASASYSTGYRHGEKAVPPETNTPSDVTVYLSAPVGALGIQHTFRGAWSWDTYDGELEVRLIRDENSMWVFPSGTWVAARETPTQSTGA
jgi:hypothetical protein